MGNLFSSPSKALQTKLLRTQQEIQKTVKSLKNTEKVRDTFTKYPIIIFMVWILWVTVYSFINSSEGYIQLLKNLSHREIPILFAIFAFRSFFLLVLNDNINKKRIKLEELKIQQEKNVISYQSQPRFKSIKQKLKSIGKYREIDISKDFVDYNFTPKPITSDNIFTRLAQVLTHDGPDYRYAIICPSCDSHNGTIAPEEAANLQYVCRYCRYTVTMDRVVAPPPQQSHIDAVEELGELEAPDNSDDLGDL